MPERSYGQFCGLARAAEVLGARWTLLVLRDLLAAPRRYSELVDGLPGIPSGGLARRLRELEEDGLVARQVGGLPDRSVYYTATARAHELAPALDALARWGAAGMREPREGEVVTDSSLAMALRSGVRADAQRSVDRATYQVNVGDAVAHVTVRSGTVAVHPGPMSDSDLVVRAGPAFRDVLAGVIGAETAVVQGIVELEGDPTLFSDFVKTFSVPYSPNVDLRR